MTKVKEDGAAGTGEPTQGLIVVNKNSIALPTSGDTFESWGQAALSKTVSDLTDAGYFMTNVVQSSKKHSETPTNSDIFTLVDLSGCIKSTPAEAEAAKAEFYVERAVGKVQLDKFDTSSGITLSTHEFGVTEIGGTEVAKGNVTCKITNWGLTNTNTQTYLVRKWTNGNAGTEIWFNAETAHPRFIGDVITPVRTYWGEDPNYATTSTGDLTAASVMPATKSNIFYCLENTFNLASQKIPNTTCAIFEVEIDRNGTKTDFYLLDGNKTTLYDQTGAQTYVANYYLTNYGTLLIEYFTSLSKTGPITASVTIDNTSAGTKEPTVQFTCDGETKTLAEFNSYLTTASKPATINPEVLLYKNSTAYYIAPIMHFGDTYCPWNNASDPTAAGSYGDAANADQINKFLGRYGVLRNNWYVLDVDKVLQIGSPTITDLNVDRWDDETKMYISCRVNVLAWAKRTQSVTLQ